MQRPFPDVRDDAESYGAEALPAGFGDMRKALQDGAPAEGRHVPQPPPRPVVGLIALAALWMNRRGGA